MEPRSYSQKKVNRDGEPLTAGKLALYGLLIFACFVGFKFIGTFVPGNRGQVVNWAVFVPLAFVGAMALAFVWPFVARLASASHVVISEKGINNNIQAGSGVHVRHWPWSELGPLNSGTDEGRQVLIVSDPQGREINRFALSDKVSLAEVRRTVEQSGGAWSGEG